MEIKEIKENNFEEVKNLLVELQEFVIEIDNFNLNTIAKDYREKYFKFMMKDCEDNQGKIFVATNKVIGMIAGFIQNYDERDILDYTCTKKDLLPNLP